jgi:Recombination endonuclease VII
MPYKDIEKARECQRASQIRHRAKLKAAGLLSQQDRRQKVWQRFHLTWDAYQALQAKYDYKCGACGRPESDNGKFVLSIDHDHACCSGRTSCGKCIRGLLCNRCNRALGLFGDSVELLKKAIEYLETHDAPRVKSNRLEHDGDHI